MNTNEIRYQNLPNFPALAHIVATTEDGLMGIGNHLPWKTFKPDLRFFKAKTTDHVVIMGNNTVLSLPFKLEERYVVRLSDCRPTPIDQLNEIENKSDECLLYNDSSADALDSILVPVGFNEDMVFIAGGKKVYNETLPYVHLVYRNVLHDVKLMHPTDGSQPLHYYPIEQLKEHFILISSSIVTEDGSNLICENEPYMTKEIWMRKP